MDTEYGEGIDPKRYITQQEFADNADDYDLIIDYKNFCMVLFGACKNQETRL